MKRNKQMRSLTCSKNCEMNYVHFTLSIKKVKFMEINFCGPT